MNACNACCNECMLSGGVLDSTKLSTLFVFSILLQISSFKQYVELYLKVRGPDEEEDVGEPPKIVCEKAGPRWEVCVTVSHKGFQQASFVNSIATTKVLTTSDIATSVCIYVEIFYCLQWSLSIKDTSLMRTLSAVPTTYIEMCTNLPLN